MMTSETAITIPMIVINRAHSLNADAESLMSFNHFIQFLQINLYLS